MSYVVTNNKYYAEIAAAIREKLGSTVLYKPSEMAAAIGEITGGGSESRLPSGYTELEYIGSTGAQYIDTGFKANQNTRLVMSGYNESVSSAWIYGAWNATNSGAFAYLSVNKYFVYGSQQVTTSAIPVGAFTLDHNKNAFTLNGTTVSGSTETFTGNYSLYLLALNVVGSVSSGKLTGKLYSCQIYDNGTLVRDYVPCRNPYGGVGLFDLVNGQFYGNAGTGVFDAGAPVVDLVLPSGYTRMEYIESSGTQHIDTGFVPNSNTRVVIDIEVLTSATRFLFGSRTNSSANSSSVAFAATQTSAGTMRSDYGSSEVNVSATSLNKRITIDKNKNRTIVGNITAENATQTFTGAYNLVLFSVNTAGTINTTKASAKLYSCQIYDNGTLVRAYVPCINPSGAYGLYDMVNAKFYGNAGSGSFTGA